MRRKVVVVDDHQLMLEAVRAALAAPDFEIVGEARSGEEALELVEEHNPDLVLLDIRMPGMAGLECLAALRARRPDTMVVVLSGVDDPAVERQALDGGASAYVSKLLDPRDLAETLRGLIGDDVGAGAHASAST
jgi:DNA-binding NarL/FixJ family response regulator